MRTRCVSVLAAALVLAACGGDDDATPATTLAPTDISLVPATPATVEPAPEVDLPDAAPTELTTTVLTEGSGHEAEDGDGLLVRYVGVSFDTGEEFDTNFGGQPFAVTLGQGRVIEGWEEGLIGAQAGSRIQLDIPAHLAYGEATATTEPAATEGTDTTESAATDTTEPAATGGTGGVAAATSEPATTTTTTPAPAGPPTGPLSFVIDVLAVVPPTDLDDAPGTDEIPTLCPRAETDTTVPATSTPDGTTDGSDDTSGTESTSTETTSTETTTPETTVGEATTPDTASSGTATEATCDVHVDAVTTDDLVEGDGPTAEEGQVAIINFVFARADNGVVLRSTWDNGQPEQIALIPGAEMTGMIEGIEGMQVGGRRVITVPYMEAFGERGYPTVGLPGETDVVVVVDLLGVYS